MKASLYQLTCIVSVLFSLVFATDISAQTFFESDSSIQINYDERLDVLMERYNRTHQLRGYRIQIISSSKKDKAKKAHSRFAASYAQYTVHESYQQPFFTVKVGDFLTKIEAEKCHRMIKEEYPGSFIVPDFIEPFEQYTYRN